MKKLIYYIGILVCTNILLYSCIGEDMSNCPQGGIVPQFVLVAYAENKECKPLMVDDSLHSGQVYVFSEQTGLCVATFQIPGTPQLNKTYTPDWGLPAGQYTYVAWFNNDEHSFQTDPDNRLLQFLVPQTRNVDNTVSIPFLCYGHLDNEALDFVGNHLITIPVMQFRNRVNLTVTDMNYAPVPNDKYTVSINDNNGDYGFDGNFATGNTPAGYSTLNQYFTYSTTEQVNSDVLSASLNVLKLAGNRNPTFAIKNSAGEQIFSANLIQLILSSIPNNDFDKTHIYDIVINNLFGNGEEEVPLVITINGWIVDQSNVELNIN